MPCTQRQATSLVRGGGKDTDPRAPVLRTRSWAQARTCSAPASSLVAALVRRSATAARGAPRRQASTSRASASLRWTSGNSRLASWYATAAASAWSVAGLQCRPVLARSARSRPGHRLGRRRAFWTHQSSTGQSGSHRRRKHCSRITSADAGTGRPPGCRKPDEDRVPEMSRPRDAEAGDAEVGDVDAIDARIPVMQSRPKLPLASTVVLALREYLSVHSPQSRDSATSGPQKGGRAVGSPPTRPSIETGIDALSPRRRKARRQTRM